MNLFRNRRAAAGREAREPTLPGLVLTSAGLLLLLGVCGAAIFSLPTFGNAWLVFAAVAAVLAWLVVGPRLRPSPAPALASGRQRWARRIRGGARKLFVVVLAGWLGLIGWSELSP